jgi:hypothetical protein
MTGQIPDIIILDGEVFPLYATPLYDYFQRIDWRPSFLSRISDNLRGYVARWEVFDKRLFLTGLFGLNWIVPSDLLGKLAPDPDPYEPGQANTKSLRRADSTSLIASAFEPRPGHTKSLRLEDLFPEQAPLVVADWVTGELVVPTGPRLVYVHMGFGSLHASYRLLEVVKGRVVAVEDLDGREWARRNERFWPDDKWYKEHPQALIWPEPKRKQKQAKTKDKPEDWRKKRDSVRRLMAYRHAQIDALRRPCGHTPGQENAKAQRQLPSSDQKIGPF